MDEQMIVEIAEALSPLVNEHMDEEMRAAWLDDLARAAHSVIAGKVAELEWQPIETVTVRRALIFDAKWGVTEALRSDRGKWALATFNGQIIEAHPTHWMPLPDPPAALAPHPKARNEHHE